MVSTPVFYGNENLVIIYISDILILITHLIVKKNKELAVPVTRLIRICLELQVIALKYNKAEIKKYLP